ncbi:hypothetical protein NHX12_009453 [Muraenolepis orangiensis]|uniref:Uncharacterized protein n=1 Tax=Muraenolepis orangiensis TaxID=630683 RepID=A0A9Q0DHP1_9TELE|nr:hypothetical protein NHX12_009453 [Muraenolepis orangiensis]
MSTGAQWRARAGPERAATDRGKPTAGRRTSSRVNHQAAKNLGRRREPTQIQVYGGCLQPRTRGRGGRRSPPHHRPKQNGSQKERSKGEGEVLRLPERDYSAGAEPPEAHNSWGHRPREATEPGTSLRQIRLGRGSTTQSQVSEKPSGEC